MTEKKWIKGMKAFRADPTGHYKAGITRREKQIERWQRLIKTHKMVGGSSILIERYERLITKAEAAIAHLKVLIKKEEAKKND